MRLAELIASNPPTPDLQGFRCPPANRMPPLNMGSVSLERLVGNTRDRLNVAVCGNVSFLLRYKGYEGAVLSLEEAEGGERWVVTQVQGARSRKSYRLTLGMKWQAALGTDVKNLAKSDPAEVRQLAMPRLFDIKGMHNVEPKAFMHTESAYAQVRHTLDLRFSQQDNMYVADI